MQRQVITPNIDGTNLQKPESPRYILSQNQTDSWPLVSTVNRDIKLVINAQTNRNWIDENCSLTVNYWLDW